MTDQRILIPGSAIPFGGPSSQQRQLAQMQGALRMLGTNLQESQEANAHLRGRNQYLEDQLGELVTVVCGMLQADGSDASYTLSVEARKALKGWRLTTTADKDGGRTARLVRVEEPQEGAAEEPS